MTLMTAVLVNQKVLSLLDEGNFLPTLQKLCARQFVNNLSKFTKQIDIEVSNQQRDSGDNDAISAPGSDIPLNDTTHARTLVKTSTLSPEKLCYPDKTATWHVHCLIDEEIRLPTQISELIFQTCMEENKIDNHTMHIFSRRNMNLERVKIECVGTGRNGGISKIGLLALHGHHLMSLELHHISSHLEYTLCDDVIAPCVYKSLRELKIIKTSLSGSTGIEHEMNEQSLTTLLTAVKNLTRIHTLCLVDIGLSDCGLSELCNVTNTEIRHLDISENPITDLTPLRKLSHQLHTLMLFNLQRLREKSYEVIAGMSFLMKLDLSCDPGHHLERFLNADVQPFPIDLLLKSPSVILPSLVHLDLSGREHQSVKNQDISNFLASHSSIEFIGLLFTEMSLISSLQSDISNHQVNPYIEVATDESLNTLLESLLRYIHRPTFIQKLLVRLFHGYDLTLEEYCGISKEKLVKLICDCMYKHLTDLGVQLAGTACLYKLTREDNSRTVLSIPCISYLTALVLKCMKEHKTSHQLQRNSLLTICTDRILTEAEFDRLECCKISMDLLCKRSEDESMTRMAVAIVSILAAKISTAETTLLASNNSYMERLIRIAEKKLEQRSTDCVMKFTLSALWNLTDESPQACHCFINLSGLDLAMQCLHHYKESEQSLEVLTKVVGLLNNIAEVGDLRWHLIQSEFINRMLTALKSSRLEYAYFSAGILSNLVCDKNNHGWGQLANRGYTHIYQHVQDEMVDEIGKWAQPPQAMVAYRCFRPFVPLLKPDSPSAVKLWALWAIEHVCVKCPSKYIQTLIEERIDQAIVDLGKITDVDCPKVTEQARKLRHFIETYDGTSESEGVYELE